MTEHSLLQKSISLTWFGPQSPAGAFQLVFAGLGRFLHWSWSNIHLRRRPGLKGREKRDEDGWMDDGGMEEGGSESLCHTERLPVTHKPGGRAMERRTYFQALELSKALPRTHGQTYVPPSRPVPPPHVNPTHVSQFWVH